MIRQIVRLGLGIIVAAALSLGTIATAAVKDWTDGTGFWSTPANWSGGTAPVNNDLVNLYFTDGVGRTITYDIPAITLGSMNVSLKGGAMNATLSMAANSLSVGTEYVGYDGRGTIEHSGGTNTISAGAGSLDVGVLAGSTGTYNLSGTGALVVNTDEYIGDAGTGIFNQTGGTHNNGSKDLYLGYKIGGTGGTYTLSAGNLNMNFGREYIGNYVSGAFNQSGGTNTAFAIFLGESSDNLIGTYNLGGTGVITLSSELFVGDYGTGNFNQSGGTITSNGEHVGYYNKGVVNHTSGTNLTGYLDVGTVGDFGGGGTYTLSGNGVLSVAGDAYVGGSYFGPGGTGVMNLNGGTATATGILKVWNTTGSVINLAGATLSVGSLDTNGNAAHFNWTSGTLNLTNSGLTIGSAGPLGTSLAIDSAKVLTVAGTTTIDPLRTLTLNGGSFSTGNLVNNGRFVFDSGTLSATQAGGTLSGSIVSNTPNTIISINANNVSLGNAASFTGFNHQGVLNVGANTVTLNSAGYARLGVLTSLTGGTINAPGGVAFATGSNMLGHGAINAQVTGELGSVIEADGALALGDAASPAGFNFAGQLRTKQFAVTLNSSTAVGLGNLTVLGSGASPGTLNATNGYVVDFDEAVTGFGTINSTNTLAKRATINGTVQGNSPAQPITLSGWIKGTGSFNNVTFSGTFDPGLSPTLSTVGSISLSPTSTLKMELGGTSRSLPTQYDAILASGNLTLGGTLQVSLINSFSPTSGNSFDILDWATLTGKFASIQLPPLTAPMGWDLSQLYTTGAIAATNYVKGDINRDSHVDVADISAFETALSDLDKYKSTNSLTDPQQFDLVANVNGDDQVDNADIQALIVYLANNAGALPAPGGSVAAVPEPASLVLFALGAIVIATLARLDHRVSPCSI